MRYSYSQRRTAAQYRTDIFAGVQQKTTYDIPVLSPYYGDVDCERLVAFHEVHHCRDIGKCGVHFFLDDYRFERVWNAPQRYAHELKKARFVLSPDFSLYIDMPLCQQIYNTYRNRLMGAYFQRCGLTVIPTVGWGDERSYDFCFSGIPKGNVCAVSNVGNCTDEAAWARWYKGFHAMICRLAPCKIIVYGSVIEGNYNNIIYFCNNNIQRMRGDGR